jgi:NADPH-dependent 7-cyano-7-deazaguanine reductase QueF-like protein
MLQFQLEILQTWGGYESLYRVTDADNQKSIGMAAEDFIKGVDIWSRYYTWRLETEDIRNGY